MEIPPTRKIRIVSGDVPEADRVRVYEDFDYAFEDYLDDNRRMDEIMRKGGGWPLDFGGLWADNPHYAFLIDKYGSVEKARVRMHIMMSFKIRLWQHEYILEEHGLAVIGHYDEHAFQRTIYREEVVRAYLEGPWYIDRNSANGPGLLSIEDPERFIKRAVELAAEADAGRREGGE